MDLDGHTLLVTGFAARVAFALIFLVTWLRSQSDRYLLDWGTSAGLIALGMATVLFGSPPGDYLAPAAGCLAYSLLGLGLATASIGVRRFDGRRLRAMPLLVAALAPGGGYAVVLLLGGRPNIAFAVMLAGLAAGACVLAVDLLLPRIRRSLPSRYLAGAAFAGYLASFLVSAVLSVLEASPVSHVLQSDVVTLAVDHVCGLFSNVALLALAGERARAELENLATRDPLTGLDNRRGLGLAARRLIPDDDGATPAVAVLVADLDRFKLVNDRHGHAAGDRVLVRFAEIARSELRRDIDLLARWGGEEFVAVLPGSSLAEAIAVAERIRLAVAAEHFLVPPVRLRLTVSIGAAALAPGETTLDAAIARADTALYAAKQGGRNRVAA